MPPRAAPMAESSIESGLEPLNRPPPPLLPHKGESEGVRSELKKGDSGRRGVLMVAGLEVAVDVVVKGKEENEKEEEEAAVGAFELAVPDRVRAAGARKVVVGG